MKTTKNINHSGSNSLNKNNYTRSSQISSNVSSIKKANEPIKSKNLNKSVLETIYDDEFVIMINQLSTSIKNYYRSNNKNFNIVKALFNKSDSHDNSINIDNELLVETFNKMENNFSFFYSSAKQIFKSMKIYRREKITNILSKTKKKNGNNKNSNNNVLDYNSKQKYSDTKLNQLLKSPNELSSKNVFKKSDKNRIMSINLMSNDRNQNQNIEEKNINEFYFDNDKENDFKINSNRNNNNFSEYFNVINTYSKKNAMKSSTNLKELKFKEENNKSLINSAKQDSNSRNHRIFFSSLNKSDKNPKNKQLSFFSNTLNNKQRVKSSDKDIKKSFDSNLRNKSNNKKALNQENIETSENLNEIIKEKEELIINLKANKTHL